VGYRNLTSTTAVGGNVKRRQHDVQARKAAEKTPSYSSLSASIGSSRAARAAGLHAAAAAKAHTTTITAANVTGSDADTAYTMPDNVPVNASDSTSPAALATATTDNAFDIRRDTTFVRVAPRATRKPISRFVTLTT